MAGELGRLRKPQSDRGREPYAWRRVLFAVLILAGLSAMFAPLFLDRTAEDAPKAKAGRILLGDLGQQPVRLEGEWTLTWRSPVAPGGPARGESFPVAVPGQWKGTSTPSGEAPRSGLATYALDIAGLPAGRYVLYVPVIFSASQVWIDDRLASRRGWVGETPATSRDHWRPQDIAFSTDGGEVRVRIDVAAFHHRDNGMENTPTLGPEQPMRPWIATLTAQDFLFNASLVLLSVYGVVVFFFRPTERASLYFGLSCLAFIPASTPLRNDNLLLMVAPDIEFRGLLLLTYLGGIAAISLFLAYGRSLFPKESLRLAYWTLQGAYGVCALVNLFAFVRNDTMLASFVSPVFSVLTVLGLAYTVIVVATATVRGRDGAAVFLLGLMVFAASITINTIVANGWLPRNEVIAETATPLGLLVLLFSHVIILAERWSSAIRNAEALADDMRRLIDVSSAITSEMRIETLLAKIVATTSNFLHADRSSLFLFDQRRNFLWSLVAQGLGRREIHLGADEGIAGYAFSTGSTINVQDAYRHPRFNREVDEATGYRTKSILAMPIAARDGRKLGVMQALNQLDGRTFDDGDIERMRAFASQAAIAIDNATLFSEVVEARNYNESILGSMSNGVITLDAEGRLMKMNAAACAIMEIEASQFVGRHFSEVLIGDNAWFVPEISGVLADARPRTFLDVNFRTGGGRVADMNVQIVPLQGENANNGLLVLAEDISEGKRMEGAMRRFMTPQVVDQVLQNQDDILFGTSCRASVLFADIRNFTTMAETLTPRETVDMLNEIFAELVEAVSTHDGVLDKFMGDAVMAVYGAPLSSGRDTENAIDSAIAMMRAVRDLNERRAARGAAPLNLGIGIASGDVVAGTIGSPKRMDYTVIGDSVNLASRLQNTTKHYKAGIVVCEATSRALADPDQLRQLDTIRVRGRSRPERIYQVLAYHSEATFQNMAATLGAYRTGMACIGGRNWSVAVEAFAEAVRLCPDDRPSALQLARARQLVANPPPADWDGVWTSPDDA